jgi:3-oxoacyl-[acyl-carrier protein] reductase
MDLCIRGKLALVTGASSGIGEAVALALGREGVRLAIAARRRDRLEDVARRATAAGAQEARAFTVDLADPVSLQKLTEAVDREMGPAEILIVNGGGPKPGAFTQTAPADWDAAYALTLQSALRLIQAVLPGMRARRWGRIVALESIVVKQPFPGMVLSNALRASVAAALKTLSSEVAAEGVTVNTIATGLVETDRLRAVYDTPAKMAAAAAGIPMKRPASPAEYAPLVVFLCGEPARYVTGQTISIDGGLTAGIFG